MHSRRVPPSCGTEPQWKSDGCRPTAEIVHQPSVNPGTSPLVPYSELKLVHASAPPLAVPTVAPSADSLSTWWFPSDMVCSLHTLLSAAQTASQLNPAAPMIHGGGGTDGGAGGVAAALPGSSHRNAQHHQERRRPTATAVARDGDDSCIGYCARCRRSCTARRRRAYAETAQKMIMGKATKRNTLTPAHQPLEHSP